MFYYQSWLNTLPELGVVVNFPVEAAVILGFLVDDRMLVTEVRLVVLTAVVSLLSVTTETVLVWSVVVIVSCDNVSDGEDVAVRCVLVSRAVLFIEVKAEVSLLVELELRAEWVDIDVLDGRCVSVVFWFIKCVVG